VFDAIHSLAHPGRGEKFFKVVIGNRIESLSVDRLKPHAGDSPALASPPR
jgi:hypothetical protein